MYQERRTRSRGYHQRLCSKAPVRRIVSTTKDVVDLTPGVDASGAHPTRPGPRPARVGQSTASLCGLPRSPAAGPYRPFDVTPTTGRDSSPSTRAQGHRFPRCHERKLAAEGCRRRPDFAVHSGESIFNTSNSEIDFLHHRNGTNGLPGGSTFTQQAIRSRKLRDFICDNTDTKRNPSQTPQLNGDRPNPCFVSNKLDVNLFV